MLNFNDFLGYAKHETERENIIQAGVEAARRGDTDFSIMVDDDYSDADIEEIQNEIQRRLLW